MSSHSSFLLTYILTFLTCYSAADYTYIRQLQGDVFEECKIVSHCDDNGLISNTSSFTTIDYETGTVKVILPGSFETYLRLLVRLEGSSCSSRALFPHSVYNCIMPNETVPSECTYQEVIFPYLYSSCYDIYNGNGTLLLSGSVQTNYTTDLLKRDCNLNVGFDLIQETYALISVNITPFLHNSVLKFLVNNSECTPDTDSADFWWRVEIKENTSGSVILEKNETENTTVDCVIAQSEIGFHQLRCAVNWTDILGLMIIREISRSPMDDAYCVPVTCKDTRPLRPYDTTEHIFPAADVPRTTNTMVLMFIPLTAIVIYICLSLYFSDSKDHTSDEKSSSCSDTSSDLKCKVLLLYPQDCDSFMATMKCLQHFLQTSNFEVYDFFDPKRFGEIACDPQGWISKLLSQKDVRIILAETDTALLHQLAIAKKCVVNYVSPLPYSNLFAYGLQNLLHSLRPQEYSRIFLIRFEDITQEKENLKLSRYQRYKLPEHLRNLISCMSNCNTVTFKEIEESSEMKRLKHSIDMFREFQQHNPGYQAKLCDNLTKLT